MSCYVEIIEDASGNVVQRMGPMSERQANRVADGVSINLDHDNYSVYIVNGDCKTGDEA